MHALPKAAVGFWKFDRCMLTDDVVLLTMNLVTRIEVKLVIKAIVPRKKKK